MSPASHSHIDWKRACGLLLQARPFILKKTAIPEAPMEMAGRMAGREAALVGVGLVAVSKGVIGTVVAIVVTLVGGAVVGVELGVGVAVVITTSSTLSR